MKIETKEDEEDDETVALSKQANEKSESVENQMDDSKSSDIEPAYDYY